MSYSGVGRFKFKWDVIQWCRGGSNSSKMSYSGVGRFKFKWDVIQWCREVQIQVGCIQWCREVQIQVGCIQWCRGGSNSSGMSYSGVGEVQIQVICHTVV